MRQGQAGDGSTSCTLIATSPRSSRSCSATRRSPGQPLCRVDGYFRARRQRRCTQVRALPAIRGGVLENYPAARSGSSMSSGAVDARRRRCAGWQPRRARFRLAFASEDDLKRFHHPPPMALTTARATTRPEPRAVPRHHRGRAPASTSITPPSQHSRSSPPPSEPSCTPLPPPCQPNSSTRHNRRSGPVVRRRRRRA